MSEVKRVEARGVLRELKLFAFEGNRDFQQGYVRSVEMQKSFVFATQPVQDPDGSIDIPYQKTIVGFQAHRMGKVRNHNNYDYMIQATSERSIPRIPRHIMNKLLSEEYESDAIEQIEQADPDDAELTEAKTITFVVSDDTIGQIDVSQSYEISVNDEQLFEHSDNDIFYDTPGEIIEMPLRECEDDRTERFIVEPITHERLPIDEKIASEIAFRAILSPFVYTEYQAVIDFRDAAERIRVIMDVMRNGVNVRQLYDELNK